MGYTIKAGSKIELLYPGASEENEDLADSIFSRQADFRDPNYDFDILYISESGWQDEYRDNLPYGIYRVRGAYLGWSGRAGKLGVGGEVGKSFNWGYEEYDIWISKLGKFFGLTNRQLLRESPQQYLEMPFFLLLSLFSSQTTIGPHHASLMLADFNQFENDLKRKFKDDLHWLEGYNILHHTFSVGADNGAILWE